MDIARFTPSIQQWREESPIGAATVAAYDSVNGAFSTLAYAMEIADTEKRESYIRSNWQSILSDIQAADSAMADILASELAEIARKESQS